MILGPISLLDCVVFVLLLIPQLLLNIRFMQLARCIIQILPFLVFQLPFKLIRERYLWPADRRSPFARNASLFQDLVIRCVRYAFARIPASIGRVFFSKWVVYPFMRFRMLRHGIFRSPISFQEVKKDGFAGLWITPDRFARNDIAIFYCHGGGFSMGSSYFYLEFLMAWASCLQQNGFKNPLILALEYSLVPDQVWPIQFNETAAAYRYLAEYMGDASKICVGGDSAGASLVLSQMLHHGELSQPPVIQDRLRAGLAVLVSPWTHLVSDINRNTPSDYLDADSLHLYAKQYAGEYKIDDPILSPGLTVGRWKEVSPLHGYYFIFGKEEVFANGIGVVAAEMKKEGVQVWQDPKENGIHAWPVVSLFLGSSRAERLEGLEKMTAIVAATLKKSA